MDLFVDESVERQIVEALRQDNHQVWYVAELSPSVSDEEVLKKGNDSRALVVTADKDFGHLVFRQEQAHPGVVLLRLAGLSNAAKAAFVVEVLRNRASELPGAFTVVSPGVVRVQKSSPP